MKVIGVLILMMTNFLARAEDSQLLIAKRSYEFMGGGVQTIVPEMADVLDVLSRSEVSSQRLESGVLWKVRETNLIARSAAFPWRDGRLEFPAWAFVYEGDKDEPVKRLVRIDVMDSYTPVVSVKMSVHHNSGEIIDRGFISLQTGFDENHERISLANVNLPNHFSARNRFKLTNEDHARVREWLRVIQSDVARPEKEKLQVNLQFTGQDGTILNLYYSVQLAKIVLNLERPKKGICKSLLRLAKDKEQK